MLLTAILVLLFSCSEPPAPSNTPSSEPAPAEATVEEANEKPTPPQIMRSLKILHEASLAELLASSDPDNPRVQVISFWATWCTPCIVEIVLLNALATIHTEVDFILVNIDHPSLLERRVVPFLRERQLNKVQLYHLDNPDPNVVLGKVVPNWPDSIPVTLIKDKTGTIREQFNANVSREQLEEALQRVSH